nr:unnamed protein product [Digitaria exilis]
MVVVVLRLPNSELAERRHGFMDNPTDARYSAQRRDWRSARLASFIVHVLGSWRYAAASTAHATDASSPIPRALPSPACFLHADAGAGGRCTAFAQALGSDAWARPSPDPAVLPTW